MRAIVAALLAAGLSACQALSPQAATVPVTSADQPAPTLEELRNAGYQGVEEAGGAFPLTDGKWEGRPFAAGGASRPAVTLARDFRLAGDLDGDGGEEAVVLLAANSGGSGEMLYLAVVARSGAQLTNIATARVGDRVQVREGRIEARRILLDVVQAGANDAMCCPGDLVSRSWELQDDRLREGAPVATGRLSVAALAGSEWVLRAWARDEPAPAQPEATLRFEGDRIGGHAGCNRYFGTVKDGDKPGDLTLGPLGATRMMCAEPQMAVETRFTRQLAGVRKMGFMAGQLALSYEKDGAIGTMLFGKR